MDNKFKTNIFALIVFLFAALLQVYFLAPLREEYQPRARLLVRANIEKGSVIDVFLNNDNNRVYTQKISQGEEKDYFFEDVPAKISFIRLDITDVPKAKVQLSRIALVADNGKTEEIAFDIFSTWPKNQMHTTEQKNKILFLESDSNDPFIYAGDLTLGEKINAKQQEPGAFFYFNSSLILCGLALLLVFFSKEGFALIFPVIIYSLVYFYLTPYVYKYLEHYHYPLQNPSSSVGNAIFSGYSKFSEQVKLVASLALSVFVSQFFILIEYLFCSKTVSEGKLERRNISVSFVLLMFIAFFVLNFPPLEASNVLVKNIKHSVGGFDSNNIFTWDYLANNGFLPFRDYWFPYGGDYLELGIFPNAMIWKFIEQLIIFSVIFFSIYEITDRKKLPCLLILLPLAFFINSAYFVGTKRYLLCFSALVYFYTLYLRRYSQMFPYVLFGLYLAWCFSQEPSQLIYAFPGILLILITYLFSEYQAGKIKKTFAQLFLSLATFLLAIGFYLINLYVNMQLPGFYKLYSNLDGAAVASSVPATLSQWVEFKLSWENALFFGINFGFFTGLFTLLRRSKYRNTSYGILLLALCFVTLMVFEKMLIRPHMAKQVIVLVYFSLCFYLYYCSSFFRRRGIFCFYFLFGIATGYFWSQGVLKAYAFEKIDSFYKFKNNLRLALEKPELSKEEINKFYSYETFVDLDPNNRAAMEYLKTKNFREYSNPLYVLGDSSYYYVGLKLKPCPYISLYDASSRYAQVMMAECLENEKPDYVLWDSSSLSFDSVPNVLRVPLIFQAVMKNYILEKSFENVHILRRRQEQESFDWQFWTTKLGSKLDLGALPWISNYSSYKECGKGDLECDKFLLIKAKNGTIGNSSVEIAIGNNSYILSFTRPKDAKLDQNNSVGINLNRLWFFELAEQNGLRPNVSSSDTNLELKIINKEKRNDLLY